MKLSIKKDKTPTKIPFIIPMKVCFPITSKTLASETSFLARALITIARDCAPEFPPTRATMALGQLAECR